MNWYYTKKGSFRTRSIVSDDQLSMMATAGELQEDDLLMSEKTSQKWVRAQTVPDLFTEPEPEPEPEPQKEAEVPAEALPEPPKDSHRLKSAVVAVILAIVAVLTVIVASQIKKDPPLPPPPTTPTPDVDPWETVEADMAALIKKEHLGDARIMLADYVEANGEDTTSSALRAQMDKHSKRGQLSTLYARLIRCAATPKDVTELITLSGELNELDNLKNSLRTTLTAKKPPSSSLCLGILDLSKRLKDETLQSLAVSTYAKVLDISTSEKACLELIDVYISCAMTDKVLGTLTGFTERNPESARIWLELSAHLALAEKAEESLEALKKAVKLGGDDTREAARRDPRFESLKDTWTFKWNTR